MKDISPLRLEYLLKTSPEIMHGERGFLAGEEVTFGVKDNKLLWHRLHEHAKRGQIAMEEFTAWLIRKQGINRRQAKNRAARVWDALCFTYDVEEEVSKPWLVLDDERMSWSMRLSFRAALKAWALYVEDPLLATELAIRTLKKKTRVLENAPPLVILTTHEVVKLLKAIDHLREDPRYPWAYPILRLLVMTGIPIRDLIWLDRATLQRSLEQGRLAVWNRSKRRCSLPVDMLRDELQMLWQLPYRWETIQDIIAPAFSRCGRNARAASAIRTVMKGVYKRAKIEQPRNWLGVLRLTSAYRYYKQTKNLIAASQLMGTSDIQSVRRKFDRLDTQLSK